MQKKFPKKYKTKFFAKLFANMAKFYLIEEGKILKIKCQEIKIIEIS